MFLYFNLFQKDIIYRTVDIIEVLYEDKKWHFTIIPIEIKQEIKNTFIKTNALNLPLYLLILLEIIYDITINYVSINQSNAL